MLTSKKASDMEQEIKGSISMGFFEHGSHSDMDLVFYEAYSAVKSLRMLLEIYEEELREEAEDIKKKMSGGEKL